MYKIINILGGNDKSIKWKEFRHNGPMFPKSYKKHNIPIIVNGKKIILDDIAEEIATMYAKYIKSDYMENKVFKKNFWKDLLKLLPKSINYLEEIDFTLIYNYLQQEKEKRYNLTKEEKLQIKLKNEKLAEPYKYCIIDGATQSVGNYKIEPPSIFIGRGNHPKIGKIKRRIVPEDVTLNIDKTSKIPEPNIPGHKWGKIIHDNRVVWLASWKDGITGKTKYIFTSEQF